MRRSYALALAAIVPVLLVVLLLPSLAYASNAYTGTYAGQANGTSKDGKHGDSTVTVWVEDLGSTTRLTFQIDKIGLTVAVEGQENWSGNDSLNVPLDVDKVGVKGTATITFTRSGEGWLMTCDDASGKALSYDGTGSLNATMTSTGFDYPPAGTQISDMFSDIFNGPPDTTTKTNAYPTLKIVQAASSFAPAKTAPPITDEKKAAAAAVSVVFMLLIVLFV